MGQTIAEGNSSQPGEIAFAVHVGVDQQERFGSEKRQRVGDAAGGLQALALARVVQSQAVGATVAQPLDDALAEVRDVDDRFAKAGSRQALEVPADERLAAGLDQRFRNVRR